MYEVQIYWCRQKRLRPKIPAWLQHPPEIRRHSLSCMPMQVRKNHQGRFPGFRAGKGAIFGPEGAQTPSARFRGARNRCYGKYGATDEGQ